MFVFGNGVVSGVMGTNPAIPANITVNDNIPFQYDFRSVYASILEKWFCVPSSTLNGIIMNNYQSLDIVNNSSCTPSNPNPSGENLISNYPNPFTANTTIKFTTKGGHTLIQVIDMMGRVVRTPIDREYANAGTYTISFDAEVLPNGVYYVRLQNGPTQQVKPMMKLR